MERERPQTPAPGGDPGSTEAGVSHAPPAGPIHPDAEVADHVARKVACGCNDHDIDTAAADRHAELLPPASGCLPRRPCGSLVLTRRVSAAGNRWRRRFRSSPRRQQRPAPFGACCASIPASVAEMMAGVSVEPRLSIGLPRIRQQRGRRLNRSSRARRWTQPDRFCLISAFYGVARESTPVEPHSCGPRAGSRALVGSKRPHRLARALTEPCAAPCSPASPTPSESRRCRRSSILGTTQVFGSP